jgi:hypothetical protein
MRKGRRRRRGEAMGKRERSWRTTGVERVSAGKTHAGEAPDQSERSVGIVRHVEK